MGNLKTHLQNVASSSEIGGGSGTKIISSRAYKISDQNYGVGESVILNNSNWAKSDPNNVIDLSTGMITIPSSIFTGPVRIRVKIVLSLQGSNNFTNWLYVAPICRKDGLMTYENYRGYGSVFYTASISSGSPPSGETGSPLIEGEASFEMNAGEQFAAKIYTNQSIVTDSQGFISWLLIEMEQM